MQLCICIYTSESSDLKQTWDFMATMARRPVPPNIRRGNVDDMRCLFLGLQRTKTWLCLNVRYSRHLNGHLHELLYNNPVTFTSNLI